MLDVTAHLNTGQHAHVRACTQTGGSTQNRRSVGKPGASPFPAAAKAERRQNREEGGGRKGCVSASQTGGGHPQPGWLFLTATGCRHPLRWCVEAGSGSGSGSGFGRLPSATFKSRKRATLPKVVVPSISGPFHIRIRRLPAGAPSFSLRDGGRSPLGNACRGAHTHKRYTRVGTDLLIPEGCGHHGSSRLP